MRTDQRHPGSPLAFGQNGQGTAKILGQVICIACPSPFQFQRDFSRQEGIRERQRYPYGMICYTGIARAGVYYRWGDRWSLGFSGVGNHMSSSNHFSRKQPGYLSFSGQEWQMTLSLSCRF